MNIILNFYNSLGRVPLSLLKSISIAIIVQYISLVPSKHRSWAVLSSYFLSCIAPFIQALDCGRSHSRFEPAAPLIIGPWLRAINFIPTRNARLIECHRSWEGHLRVAIGNVSCAVRRNTCARCVDGLHQVAPGSAALFILARTRVRSRAAVPFLAALWRTSAVAVIAAV